MKAPFTFIPPKEAELQRRIFHCELYMVISSKFNAKKKTSFLYLVHEPFVIFFYAIKGSIKNKGPNKGSPLHVNEGQYGAFLLAPGELELEISKDESEFFYFIFKDSLVRNFSVKLTPLQELEQHLSNNSPNHHSLPLLPFEQKINIQINKIKAYEENDIDHQIDILALLRDLSHLYCQQIENDFPYPSNEEIVQEIKQNIIDGIKRGGKLPTLAELIFRYPISVKNFFIYFKDKTGLGPQEFINQETMNLAHALLVKEEMKVKDVSEFLGFEHPSAFSTKFKKHFGYPPSKLKK